MPADCPVLADAEATLQSAQQLDEALRRLRKSMRLCTQCSEGSDCPAILLISSQLDRAIAAVVEEWSLHG